MPCLLIPTAYSQLLTATCSSHVVFPTTHHRLCTRLLTTPVQPGAGMMSLPVLCGRLVLELHGVRPAPLRLHKHYVEVPVVPSRVQQQIPHGEHLRKLTGRWPIL